ncbi:MAG TPA: hypothetical protein IAC41_04510 [Candidatus Merdenecus merdavium]|nr:hypothetical protein [Candidatus Merdenecus merdavium]
MSRGIGAVAVKVLEDDSTVMYLYGGYNLNENKYKNYEHIYDGEIVIDKQCFIEPEIHEKIKKMPSGRKKLITKRIPVSVDYPKMIESDLIKTTNCSNCWKTFDNGMDVMIGYLLFWLFQKYQEDGTIPEKMSYDV